MKRAAALVVALLALRAWAQPHPLATPTPRATAAPTTPTPTPQPTWTPVSRPTPTRPAPSPTATPALAPTSTPAAGATPTNTPAAPPLFTLTLIIQAPVGVWSFGPDGRLRWTNGDTVDVRLYGADGICHRVNIIERTP
jgi:hypothetical protein